MQSEVDIAEYCAIGGTEQRERDVVGPNVDEPEAGPDRRHQHWRTWSNWIGSSSFDKTGSVTPAMAETSSGSIPRTRSSACSLKTSGWKAHTCRRSTIANSHPWASIAAEAGLS